MMKPIETIYKGYRFRSRLEARWAVFFDTLGVKWDYELEGFELPSGRYLPDFLLHFDDGDVWAEVKSECHENPLDLIYLSGRELCLQTKKPFVLLAGIPDINRCYLAANRTGVSFVFFADYNPTELLKYDFAIPHQPSEENRFKGPCLATCDEYWASLIVVGHEGNPLLDGGGLRFDISNDRRAEQAFGMGYVKSVAAARSARFEFGESGVRS